MYHIAVKSIVRNKIQRSGYDNFDLLKHIEEVEKWAQPIIKKQPEANEIIVLTAVWLHDIGYLQNDATTDHSVLSEYEAKQICIEIEAPRQMLKEVAHCVRAHRVRDVQPKTLEAKILAMADSLSHMTGSVYTDMTGRGERDEALKKLEKDFQDSQILPIPEIEKIVLPLYEAWEKLLTVYPIIG